MAKFWISAGPAGTGGRSSYHTLSPELQTLNHLSSTALLLASRASHHERWSPQSRSDIESFPQHLPRHITPSIIIVAVTTRKHRDQHGSAASPPTIPIRQNNHHKCNRDTEKRNSCSTGIKNKSCGRHLGLQRPFMKKSAQDSR